MNADEPRLLALGSAGETPVIGCDGVYNRLLENGDRIWACGDTLAGELRQPSMYHNMLIVEHPDGSRNCLIGEPDQAMTISNPNADPAKGEWIWPHGQGFFTNTRPGEIYWPADMTFVEGKMLFFLRRVHPPGKDEDMWAFEMQGTDAVILDNPTAPPSQWNFSPIFPVNEGNRTIGVATESHGDYVYFLENDPAQDHALYLGRFQKSDAQNHTLNLTYHHPDGTWQSTLPDTPPIASGAPEASLQYFPENKEFRIIYQPDVADGVIYARSGKEEGDKIHWSSPAIMHECPNPDGNYLYGGKRVDQGTTRTDEPVQLIYCINFTPENNADPEVFKGFVPRIITADYPQILGGHEISTVNPAGEQVKWCQQIKAGRAASPEGYDRSA